MEILPVNFKFLSLKKIFQLSLVQTAKSYHIKTQQNLEFLGEIDGGAKITSNSGIPNFERKAHIVHLNEKRRRKYKNVEKMSNISELEKIFLLTLVQNAKCYCIARQENPEFLGEFDGGAKTTRQILVSYRSNTGRFEKDMPDMCPA